MSSMEVNEKEQLVHDLRKQVDGCIKSVKEVLKQRPEKGGREFALAHTKLQEAKMWLGKVLEELGSELPAQYRDEAK